MEAQKSNEILIICKMGFEFALMYLPSRRLKLGISIITVWCNDGGEGAQNKASIKKYCPFQSLIMSMNLFRHSEIVLIEDFFLLQFPGSKTRGTRLTLAQRYKFNRYTSESSHWGSTRSAAIPVVDRCPPELKLKEDDRVGVEGAPSSLTSSRADPWNLLCLRSLCSTTVSYSDGISSYTWTDMVIQWCCRFITACRGGLR